MDLDWAAPHSPIVNVTCLYIGYSTRMYNLFYTRTLMMDLRNSRLLCGGLRTVEGVILRGVGEFLGPEDLEFPVLLNESLDG